jgi:hypothetical protein
MQEVFKLGLGRSAACFLAALFGILALQSASDLRAEPTTRRELHIVSFDLVSTSTGQPPRHMHKIQTDRGLEFTDNLDGTRQLVNQLNGMQLMLNDHDKTAVVVPARNQRNNPDMPVHLSTEDQKILKLMQTTAVNSGTQEIDGITYQKWIANDPGKKIGSMALLPTVTTIWIDPKTGDVLKVLVGAAPTQQFQFSMTYTHFVINPDVPDGTLSFDPPAGYAVVADSPPRRGH